MAQPTNSTAPAHGAFAIAPNDTADLAQPTRGLFVGSAGDVRVTMGDGAVVTFKAMAAGMIHAIVVLRVHATGTTATDLVGVC